MKISIGTYEATIYPEGDGFTGAISLGFDAKGKRQRVKRKGKTKAQVKDKLREVVDNLEAGVRAEARYTVKDAVNDFLDKGLKGKSKATIDNYRSLATRNLIPQIGATKLQQLTADHLDEWMDERAEELSTRTLRLIHQILERAIRQAQARDKVRRNVASLVMVPDGKEGHPVQGDDTGPGHQTPGSGGGGDQLTARRIRGALALDRCPHRGSASADLGRGGPQGRHVAVYRSVRTKGDTKTRKSRRLLKLPTKAVHALRNTTPTKPPNAVRRPTPGMITAWCSAARTAPHWTAGRSAASSPKSPRRPDSGKTGPPESCATASCPSSATTAASGSRTSAT